MKAERIASLGFTALAAAYLIGAFFIPEPAIKQRTGLGPDAFPKAIGLLMLMFSLIYVYQQFHGKASQEDAERATIIGAEEKLGAYVDYKTIGLMLIVMVVYALLFDKLGYPVATFLMFIAGVYILDRRKWKRDLVIALVASLGIYLLFRFVLRVNLPAGILSFIFP